MTAALPLDVLRALKARLEQAVALPERENRAICATLLLMPELHSIGLYLQVKAWLREQWVQWPEYSGSIDYPVPAPPGFPIGRASHRHFHAYRTLPLWLHGEYGATRIRLAKWLIERLAAEIAAQEAS